MKTEGSVEKEKMGAVNANRSSKPMSTIYSTGGRLRLNIRVGTYG